MSPTRQIEMLLPGRNSHNLDSFTPRTERSAGSPTPSEITPNLNQPPFSRPIGQNCLGSRQARELRTNRHVGGDTRALQERK